MHLHPKRCLLGVCLFYSSLLLATDVTTDAELNSAIITANGGGDATITFLNSITLSGGFPGLNLRPVNANGDFTSADRTITINGGGFSLDGGNSFRGFFIRGGAGSVTINNLAFSNCAGTGGSAGLIQEQSGAGGGGAGLGGSLFIGSGATVTLVNPTFTSSTATGGSGGFQGSTTSRSGGSGGGGFAGSGGGTGNTITVDQEAGGGGGGFNSDGGDIVSAAALLLGGSGGGAVGPVDAPSPSSDPGSDGADDFDGVGGGSGGAGDPAPTSGTAGASGAGGGGGGSTTVAAGAGSGGAGGLGGGGGGGGANIASTAPGSGANAGAFGGGGGGGGTPVVNALSFGGDGGNGGFAGGGGGGGHARSGGTGGDGGTGGFGGGGGGGSSGVSAAGTGGSSVFGGGTGGAGIISAGMPPGGFGGGGAGFGGALFLQDGASLTIEGSASFSSSSTVAGAPGGAGATAGTTAGTDIFMMSGSLLTFDISSSVNIPTAIEGDIGAGGGSQTMGGLTKMGSGLLTLNGDNSFTGTTTVSAGELRVNSTIITETIVDAGALLSGDFTIAVGGTNPMSGNLTNSGTVSPGTNGTGTITIEGDYVQTATGIFLVDITPDGQSDRLFMSAGGTATLDGTLDVVINPGNYIAGTTYEIINAPTLGTQFATVIETGQVGDLVDIQVDYSSVILTVLTSRIFVDQNIAAGIPSEVANCFTSATITPFSDFAIVTELLGMLSDSQVNDALFILSPAIFGSLEWVNARTNSYIADILSQHVWELCCSPRDCCSCDCNASAWISIFANLQDNVKDFDNLKPFSANGPGVLIGADFCCCNFYYGLSAGYARTHLVWREDGGKGNLNSYYGALYGSWHCDCFTIDVSGIGGATEHDLKRRIEFLGIEQRTAKSEPWGYFATAHLGLRGCWEWCCTNFEPYALGDYHYFNRESFKEKGADSLNLAVRSKSQQIIRAEAGLRAYWEYMCDCSCYAPFLGLSWVGEFPLETSKQKATFKGQDCVMNVESYDSSVQLASPQVGVKLTCCNGISLTASYKGLFNKKTRINQAEARLEWIF